MKAKYQADKTYKFVIVNIYIYMRGYSFRSCSECTLEHGPRSIFCTETNQEWEEDKWQTLKENTIMALKVHKTQQSIKK
jgi:hypothetical protein